MFIYTSIYKELLVTTKEIFVYLLIIFILIFYYYICMCICTYNFDINNDNYQLSTIYNISFEELKPVSKNLANIWYKCLLDDFFNTFTSNSKTINPKFIEAKLDLLQKHLYHWNWNYGTGTNIWYK